jgi:hypothetical protein
MECLHCADIDHLREFTTGKVHARGPGRLRSILCHVLLPSKSKTCRVTFGLLSTGLVALQGGVRCVKERRKADAALE